MVAASAPTRRPNGIRDGHSGLIRTAIRVFVVLVAINAAVAITVLVTEGFGETGGRILATSLSATAAVVMALASSTARRVSSLGPAWKVGIGAAILGFALVIASIWMADGVPEEVSKTTATALVVAAFVALTGLLAMVAPTTTLHWVYWLAVGVAAALAMMAIVQAWAEIDEEWVGRSFGVVAVILAALIVVLPVLRHTALAREPAVVRAGFCPACGAPQTPTAAGRCTTCGVRYRVWFE